MLSWVGSPASGRAVEVLVKARRRAAVSQRELAAKMGMAPSVIAKIEMGERRIDVVELITLADSLHMDPKQLFAEIVDATRS